MSQMYHGPVAAMLSDRAKDKDMKRRNAMLCEKETLSFQCPSSSAFQSKFNVLWIE